MIEENSKRRPGRPKSKPEAPVDGEVKGSPKVTPKVKVGMESKDGRWSVKSFCEDSQKWLLSPMKGNNANGRFALTEKALCELFEV